MNPIFISINLENNPNKILPLPEKEPNKVLEFGNDLQQIKPNSTILCFQNAKIYMPFLPPESVDITRMQELLRLTAVIAQISVPSLMNEINKVLCEYPEFRCLMDTHNLIRDRVTLNTLHEPQEKLAKTHPIICEAASCIVKSLREKLAGNSCATNCVPSSASTTLSKPERKQRAGYKSSLKYLRKIALRDPESLTEKELYLKKRHEYNAQWYEWRRANDGAVQEPAQSTTPEGENVKKKTKQPDAAARDSNRNAASSTSMAATASKEHPKTSAMLPNVATAAQPALLNKLSRNERTDEMSGSCTSAEKRHISDDSADAQKIKCLRPEELVASLSNPISRNGRMDNKNGGNTSSGSKRHISDDSAEALEIKRLRLEQLSDSLNSKTELQVFITDQNDLEGEFTTKNWLILEKFIMHAMYEAIVRTENPFVAKFNGTKWYKGTKVVNCANEETLHFLKGTIKDAGELWPGAKIDIVQFDQLYKRTTIKVWVPNPLLDNRTLISLIKGQNLDCETSDWTLVRELTSDKGNGKNYWFSISPESKIHILNKQRQLKFGLGGLSVVFPKRKRRKNKSVLLQGAK